MWIEIGIALILDVCIGDPPNWPHPVRWIGGMITAVQRFMRRYVGNLYVAGALLSVTVVGAVVGAVLLASAVLPPLPLRILRTYLLYTCLAATCLAKEARKVASAPDLDEARKRVGYLVGRDTAQLDASSVVRATVETVAENTIDGVLAPLIYMLAGAPFGLSVHFALGYKAVNTLDSMVGYKQPPYREIGFFSAKLDDVLNWIPARVGAAFMLLAGALLGHDWRRGVRVFLRDRRAHSSPNAGHPEAAVAGLLGVELGGTGWYFGQRVEKPTLGDATRVIEQQDIRRTIWIMYTSEALLALVALGCAYVWL